MTKLVNVKRYAAVNPTQVSSLELRKYDNKLLLDVLFNSGELRNFTLSSTLSTEDTKGAYEVYEQIQEQISDHLETPDAKAQAEIYDLNHQVNQLAEDNDNLYEEKRKLREQLADAYLEILRSKCKTESILFLAIKHYFESPTGRPDLDGKALDANLLHDLDRILQQTGEDRDDRPELLEAIEDGVTYYLKTRLSLQKMDEDQINAIAKAYGYEMAEQ